TSARMICLSAMDRELSIPKSRSTLLAVAVAPPPVPLLPVLAVLPVADAECVEPVVDPSVLVDPTFEPQPTATIIDTATEANLDMKAKWLPSSQEHTSSNPSKPKPGTSATRSPAGNLPVDASVRYQRS